MLAGTYSILLFESFDNHYIQNDFTTIEMGTYYDKAMQWSLLHTSYIKGKKQIDVY